MTEPWEIDPTNTDGDRDGAEGGAMGGDSAGDTTLPPPIQPSEDIDRTYPFEPTGGTSTPYQSDSVDEQIELANMDLGDEKDWNFDDIPLLTDFTSAEDRQTAIAKALQFIKDRFPKVDFRKLGPIGFGKKPENLEEIVKIGKGQQFGKTKLYGETKIFKKDGSGLLKSFTDRFKKVRGPSSEELLAEKNQEEREMQQSMAEEEKQLKEKEQQTSLEQKTTENVQNLRKRIEETKAKRDAMEEEHGSTLEQQNEIDRLKQLEKNLKADLKNEEIELKQLQKRQDTQLRKIKQNIGKLKRDIYAKTKERNEIEVGLNRTKPLDELADDYEKLEREKKETQEIIDNENATSESKQAAADRMIDIDERMKRLRPQIQEREEALPLPESVKRIFQKYGWTLQAVVLAAGLVLGAVALAALNGLKAGTKAVGQGLKTVGQKDRLPPTWSYRIDRQLHIQSSWTGSLLPRLTRLAAHICCCSLLHGKTSQEEA